MSSASIARVENGVQIAEASRDVSIATDIADADIRPFTTHDLNAFHPSPQEMDEMLRNAPWKDEQIVEIMPETEAEWAMRIARLIHPAAAVLIQRDDWYMDHSGEYFSEYRIAFVFGPQRCKDYKSKTGFAECIAKLEAEILGEEAAARF